MLRALLIGFIGVSACVATLHAEPAVMPNTATPTTQPAWMPIGEPKAIPADLKGDVVDVAAALQDPAKFAGKTIVLRGRITEVCKKAGCWVRLAPRTPDATVEQARFDTVFVKLTCPKTGRLVPMEGKGREAFAKGELVVEEVDEATARHYAEDSGMSQEQIAKIQGPQKTLRLMTPGVHLSTTPASTPTPVAS
jgi:hypothetical protein